MTIKRILCVEDHPDTCELISTILRGYEVISAKGVADALKNAAEEKFSLYLLDYHLPDGTGDELAVSIRNFDKTTPMLFVTGTSSITENEAKRLGAQGLIRKGRISFVEDLLNYVDRLLTNHAANG